MNAAEMQSPLIDLFVRGGHAERNGESFALTYAGRQEADRVSSGTQGLRVEGFDVARSSPW